jgi:glycosyltransferase involved in cell wall biosynthesis
MSLISIVTPCFNEEENVERLCNEIRNVFNNLIGYDYEHIFIDNSSTDSTVDILKEIAKRDPRIKIIVNMRNFGPVRSPHHGIFQAKGDAVILMVADLQDPPFLISEFLKKWREGYLVVIGIKNSSNENKLVFTIRKMFYQLLNRISEHDLINNFTGFGLYDKSVIDDLRSIEEPFPYFRGLIAEFGYKRYEIPYNQPKRVKGKSKTNFYSLYDFAMLGFVNHTKIPLRLASFIGFTVSLVSIIIAFAYFIYKLLFWNDFQVGMAPMVIGLFFFGGIQLFFLGIIGEYIGAIFTRIKKRPLVKEKERINFS